MIVIGTSLMTGLASRPPFLILGGVTNGVGLLVMAVGSLVNSKRDKSEVIDRIASFHEELIKAKSLLDTNTSLREVERVENEFYGWAESLLNNIESKKIEMQKNEVLFKETELKLSARWQPMYQYAFETLRQMLAAYNEKACAAILFTIPEPPSNLFGQEAETFKAFIEFDTTAAWELHLGVTKPYKADVLPSILVLYYLGGSLDDPAIDRARKGVGHCGECLLLGIDPKKERIRVDTVSRDFYVGDVKDNYSIRDNDYKSSIRELLTVLVEHQLVGLLRNKE